MKNTTLCYIEKDEKYLLIHRTKKKHDGSYHKYMGVGGHFEENESPYDCVIREAREETGLELIAPKYRGIVTFCSDKYESEQMHLFTCTEFTGQIGKCDEGELVWVNKNDLHTLPMWEGDYVFLDLLNSSKEFFSLKLTYNGDVLIEIVLNGKKQKKPL
jgi:8-oxo-dGTP diphosphatase